LALDLSFNPVGDAGIRKISSIISNLPVNLSLSLYTNILILVNYLFKYLFIYLGSRIFVLGWNKFESREFKVYRSST
jgi:hypothetical protein